MADFRIYRTYRFIDKDPIIDAMRSIRADGHLKTKDDAALAGLAAGTLAGWFDGDTRQPKNSSVTAYTSSHGYVRHDRLRRDGTVEVRFVKARELDWQEELEKAADFMLKQNSGRKPKRRKRKNGHAP